jgi:23S rRNA (cytidine1920-2'-O)/16S rRNA (cytidine1409-2'-O)-methyltransferase
MPNSKKQRLDLELVRQGLVRSRAQAADMIKEERVLVAGVKARKASQSVAFNVPLFIDKPDVQWVGRGAHKLIAALDQFEINPKDKICLDLGASTGGFTEVLLKRGAEKIYAVDVGHEQLHPSLTENQQIINMEGINARYLTEDDISDGIDLVVSDVSFISLKKLLPAGLKLCQEGAILIALIKPQFEVGKGKLGKGGIVRDADLVEHVRKDIESWLENDMNWRSLGTIPSPVAGSDGNTEYLIGAINDRRTDN